MDNPLNKIRKAQKAIQEEIRKSQPANTLSQKLSHKPTNRQYLLHNEDYKLLYPPDNEEVDL